MIRPCKRLSTQEDDYNWAFPEENGAVSIHLKIN